jgi:hypothetical protein
LEVPSIIVPQGVPVQLEEARFMVKVIGAEVIVLPPASVPCTCTCTDPPVKPVGGIVIVIVPEPEFPALT